MPVLQLTSSLLSQNLFFPIFLSVFPPLHFCFFLRLLCRPRFSAHAELRVPRILNLGRKQLLMLLTGLAGKEGRWERDGIFFFLIIFFFEMASFKNGGWKGSWGS